MTQEDIIRSEASDFSENELKDAVSKHQGHKKFRSSLQSELYQLYQPDSKMVFLDQMKILVKDDWENHKANCPRTAKGEECPRDIKYEKILFYIQQEIDSLPLLVKTNESVISKSIRDKVFISYSHKDTEWLDKFRRHFRPFESKIEFWDDSKIQPGQKWRDEIKVAINNTKIAVLLISADFFNSDFITQQELPPLLKAAQEDGATILSVILKPCTYDEYPEISQYQAMNSPSNTVLQMNEATQELTWVELVKTIKKLINTKDELKLKIELSKSKELERKFHGEGNFLYNMDFNIGHIGYDGIKMEINYHKNKANGSSEIVDSQGFGLNLHQSRNLKFIDWEIELSSIFKDENSAQIIIRKK